MAMKKLSVLPLRNVKISDSFWSPRIETARSVSLDYMWRVLHDEVPGVPASGAVRNFRIAAGQETGEFTGYRFQDSDLYKWMEAASYAYETGHSSHDGKDKDAAVAADDIHHDGEGMHHDGEDIHHDGEGIHHDGEGIHHDGEMAKIRSRMEACIALLKAAQEPDGYLDTWTKVTGRKRFTEVYRSHELYCAGHLFEAAAAWYHASGDTELLDIACRFADCIDRTFGPEDGKLHGYPGHQEVEIGLYKLWEITKEERYLRLAVYFLKERGRQPFFFDQETEAIRAAGGEPEPYFREHGPYPYSYQQAHRPVTEQKTAVGHAVREVYMITALADVGGELAGRSAGKPAGITSGELAGKAVSEPAGKSFGESAGKTADESAGITSGEKLTESVTSEYDGQTDEEEGRALYDAAERLYRSIAETEMSVTGGIGAMCDGEAFTFPYDLPNDRCYNETCASVGLIMAGRRLLNQTRDARYADVMETSLYNNMLAGISLAGTEFFYVNPMEMWPERNRMREDMKEIVPVRQGWYGCACCPPNVVRTLLSLGQYIYSWSGEESSLWVNLLISSEVRLPIQGKSVIFRQEGSYPYDGKITFSVETDEPVALRLHIRIPGWCHRAVISRSGNHQAAVQGKASAVHDMNAPAERKTTEVKPENGCGTYAEADGIFASGDRITLALEMKPEWIYADDRVPYDAGKAALRRGPLIYCMEEKDNGSALWNLSADTEAPVREERDRELFADTLPDGLVLLKTVGYRTHRRGQLYSTEAPAREKTGLVFLPYFAWANRGENEMEVWVRQT